MRYAWQDHAVAWGVCGLGKLSARERELVTLVAQGRTNAQLYVSARTVTPHLNRSGTRPAAAGALT